MGKVEKGRCKNRQTAELAAIPEGYDELPIEGAELPKGDPFSYGKKKNWQGATGGGYFITNVPAGADRPLNPEVLHAIKPHKRKKKATIGKKNKPLQSKAKGVAPSFQISAAKHYQKELEQVLGNLHAKRKQEMLAKIRERRAAKNLGLQDR